MGKGVKIILVGILMILFLTVLNGVYIFYLVENPTNFISGNSIKETITGFYNVSSVNHRVFILFQFIALLIIVVSFFVIVRKFKSRKKLSKGDFIKKDNAKSRTDLDTLYEILKDKKEIDVGDIVGVFKVSPDVALEWSKILEDGNLAIIEYPRFGKPILKLFEYDSEDIPKKNVGDKTNLESKDTKKSIHRIPPRKILATKQKIKKTRKVKKKVRKGKKKIKK